MIALLLASTLTFKVIGIDCALCAPPVKKALASIPGVTNVRVDATAKTAAIDVPENFDRAKVHAALSNGPSFRAGRVTIDPRLNGQFQTLGRWSGAVDEGIGFRNAGLRLQISAPLGNIVVAPSVYRELWTRGCRRAELSAGNDVGGGSDAGFLKEARDTPKGRARWSLRSFFR